MGLSSYLAFGGRHLKMIHCVQRINNIGTLKCWWGYVLLVELIVGESGIMLGILWLYLGFLTPRREALCTENFGSRKIQILQ